MCVRIIANSWNSQFCDTLVNETEETTKENYRETYQKYAAVVPQFSVLCKALFVLRCKWEEFDMD